MASARPGGSPTAAAVTQVPPQAVDLQGVSEQVQALQARHEARLEEMRTRHAAEVAELQRRIALKQSGAALPAASGSDPSLSCISFMGTERAGSYNFMQEKEQFIDFVTSVEKGKDSPEFKELYNFLLKCFTDADNNFDGRLGFQEFEVMIETAAALPRRFGYAPSTPEMYHTEWDRLQQRMTLFNSLCPKRPVEAGSISQAVESKHISFDTWLEYAVNHIKEKASGLKDIDRCSRMTRSKEDFREFIIAACSSRKTREYKEFYNFCVKCFTVADTDLDGRIDMASFSSLVDNAVAAPRLFGFAPPTSEMYESEEEKKHARMTIFTLLDRGNNGYIDFDTWLHYIYCHVCQKTASLGESGIVPDVLAASTTTGNRVYPFMS